VIGLRFSAGSVHLRVAEATRQIRRKQIPGLPERMMATTALALNLPLITRDGKIRSADVQTIW
jgi:hypothetical protein